MFSKTCLPLVLLIGLAEFRADVQGADEYVQNIRPLLKRFCLECHSMAKHSGELDLKRFASDKNVRQDLNVWPLVIDMLANGEMLQLAKLLRIFEHADPPHNSRIYRVYMGFCYIISHYVRWCAHAHLVLSRA